MSSAHLLILLAVELPSGACPCCWMPPRPPSWSAASLQPEGERMARQRAGSSLERTLKPVWSGSLSWSPSRSAVSAAAYSFLAHHPAPQMGLLQFLGAVLLPELLEYVVLSPLCRSGARGNTCCQGHALMTGRHLAGSGFLLSATPAVF
jgi:hypothetical protein